jgi:hypothetical protein
MLLTNSYSGHDPRSNTVALGAGGGGGGTQRGAKAIISALILTLDYHDSLRRQSN